MARADYDLKGLSVGTVKSYNGTEYTVNFLWTGVDLSYDLRFDADGIEIEYETENQKTKDSYILSSKCTLDVLIKDTDDATRYGQVFSDYDERDVWVTIREGSNLLWCGYVLNDLQTQEDVSFPYTVQIEAVDGLAALKSIPFVRETNAFTGNPSVYPYGFGDCYMQETAGYQRFIGYGNSWIQLLLMQTGQLLAADAAGATANYLTNWKIRTSVNSWNEDHGTPAYDKDPLNLTQVTMDKLYKPQDSGRVEVPSCYAVLEEICRAWGMRVCYWEHTFWFIQMTQYNTDEDAASTPSAPINIPTHGYSYVVSGQATHTYINYFGSTVLAPYTLDFENVSAVGEGFQKLSGTQYPSLPPVHQVTAIYYQLADLNKFNGFPLLLTQNQPTPETWPTDGVAHTYLRTPQDSAGNSLYITEEDVASSQGLRLKVYLSYENTTTDDIMIGHLWTIRARPNGGSWTKVLRYSFSGDQVTWENYTGSYVLPFPYTSWYIANDIWVPPAASIDQNNGIKIIDSNLTSGYEAIASNMTVHGTIPTDAAFTGSWDFQLVTFTYFKDDEAYPMDADVSTYGLFINHGRVNSYAGLGSQTNYDGSATNVGQVPTDYAFDYLDTLNPGGTNPYLSVFHKVSSTTSDAEAVTLETALTVDNNNSFTLDLGVFFWGDGVTVKVSSDGSTFAFASDEKWGQATYSWNAGTSQFDFVAPTYNRKLPVLVSQNALYNQSIALKQFGGTSALMETNKTFSGTSILKMMCPLTKFKDLDNSNYMFMSGVFNIVRDEWNIVGNQISYNVPSETVNEGEMPTSDDQILTSGF